MKDWFYDEISHVGVDYSNEDTVSSYDSEMETFRDYEEEAKRFLDRLGSLNAKELTAIDLGCGTGAFSIHAAKYLKRIYAVDVSEKMLGVALTKATEAGIDNVEFFNSGFLQFEPPEAVDIIYTKWAFHHLPDYWKQAGLLNMNKMLKPGGVFAITDFIYVFDPHFEKTMTARLEGLSKDFTKEFVDEAKVHMRDEFSTFDWVLKGMIERAGFEIEESNAEDIFATEYFCRKVESF